MNRVSLTSGTGWVCFQTHHAALICIFKAFEQIALFRESITITYPQSSVSWTIILCIGESWGRRWLYNICTFFHTITRVAHLFKSTGTSSYMITLKIFSFCIRVDKNVITLFSCSFLSSLFLSQFNFLIFRILFAHSQENEFDLVSWSN